MGKVYNTMQEKLERRKHLESKSDIYIILVTGTCISCSNWPFLTISGGQPLYENR